MARFSNHRSRTLDQAALPGAHTQPTWDNLLPTITHITDDPYPTYEWDISSTIPELAYSTHSFFRYYGKFPSVIARQLIRQYPVPESGCVLDNFAGCGTTLVEAVLAGANSVGVELNPLGCLASKVKTTRYETRQLRETWSKLRAQIQLAVHRGTVPETRAPNNAVWLHKWFDPAVVTSLAVLKDCVLDLPRGDVRDFFLLAFLAIVRRVSRAYDGEIRPHINPKKPVRDVFVAFERKAEQMIQIADEFRTLTSSTCATRVILADNRELASVWPATTQCELVISHPPYLNSFDYFPAYRLEFAWAEGVEDVWQGTDLPTLRSQEVRAWPATNSALTERYFSSLAAGYKQVHGVMAPGGRLCVVVGDCTLRGEVIRVHKIVLNALVEMGLRVEAVNYRTTHYGVGKYAYSHRADYHGNGDDGKRDAILVVRKPW